MSDLQNAIDIWDHVPMPSPKAANEWVLILDAARRVATLRLKLAHHLTENEDPCQDRGVDWPCDVADALDE